MYRQFTHITRVAAAAVAVFWPSSSDLICDDRTGEYRSILTRAAREHDWQMQIYVEVTLDMHPLGLVMDEELHN